MNFPRSFLSALLMAVIPLPAIAQESTPNPTAIASCSEARCENWLISDNHENYQYQENYEYQDNSQESAPVRYRKERRRRSRRRSFSKNRYVGVTLGGFFPSELEELDGLFVSGLDVGENLEPSSGIGGSIFGGRQFSENFAADVEFIYLRGDVEPIEGSSFDAYGVFVNPRLILSLDQSNVESPYVYISPGLGTISLGFSDEIDELLLGDDRGTGFAIQVKAGAGLPISENFDIFGQGRYINAFQVFELVGGDDDQGFSSLALEAGLSYKF